ncbi:hypothetical protein B566_EDAN009856, partial [Ephemera danica]
MTRKSMPPKTPTTTPPVSARTRRKSTAVGKAATPSTPVNWLKNSPGGTPGGRGGTPGGRKSLKKESPMTKKIEDDLEDELPSDAEDSEEMDSDGEGQKENVEAEEEEVSDGQEEDQEDSDSEDDATETELPPSKKSPQTPGEKKKGTLASRQLDDPKNEIPSDGEDEGSPDSEKDEENSGDEDKASETKPQNGNVKKSANINDDLSKRDRTIFVGNLPKEVNHKEVSKLFSKYGKISSVRLRSAPIADSRVPKKVAVIKKDFHADRTNINAYVVFEEVASAKESLVANGLKIFDRHIRVSMLKAPPMDNNKAIFIGNLNFGADEEQVHKVFEDCGPIVSVRIVRDQVRGIGRGFAYVNFETTGAVELALLKDGAQVGKRPIRVHRCKETLKKKNRSKKSRGAHAGSPKDGAKTSESAGPKREKQDKGSETSFTGQKVGEKGKVHKKKGAKKMTPTKKQAIETLAKTMPGSTEKKSPQKGFTRYFNQEV